MKPLGDVIRQARKRQALSLRAVASGIGVNAAHLSRVETGKVKPSARLIDRLARVLGLDADQLLLMSGRVPHDLRPAAEAQAQRFIAALQNVESLGVREDRGRYDTALVLRSESRAVEDGFPFDEISDVADIESWRKEVYRPIYHIHKWWAQRLGSVFRAAILAAAVPSALQVMDLFYQPVRLPGLVVFDPFMGSGTIAGEGNSGNSGDTRLDSPRARLPPGA